MTTFFYNIVGIIIGFLVLLYLILQIKKNKMIYTILMLIGSLLLISCGIYGFFVPSDYSYIIILVLLGLSILLIILLFIINKKEQNK